MNQILNFGTELYFSRHTKEAGSQRKRFETPATKPPELYQLPWQGKKMTKYTLKEPADFNVYYQADTMRYDPQYLTARGMTKELFTSFYSHCRSACFFADEKPIGGLILDEHANEVHIAVLPEYQGRWGRLFAQAIRWIFSDREMIYGCVENSNQHAIHFMDRNHFQRVGEDRGFIKYKMTAAMVNHRRDLQLPTPQASQ